MASYEKGKYSYNGNTIFFDEAEYSNAIKAIKTVGDDVANYCGKVSQADKCFDSVPARYKSLVPKPRFSEIGIGILDDIVSAKSDVLSEMGRTVSAIVDYCNGDGFSEESQKRLDDLLSNAPSSPKGGGSPGDGGGGGGAGNGEYTLDQEMVADQEALEGIAGNAIPLEDMTTTNDEEIVLGQVDGQTGGNGNSEVFVPFSGSDETLETGADGTINDSSELGTSLFGNSSFSVPSVLSSNGKVDGIKGAGVLGAAGIAAAAAAAIGGKVFYDKKHADDEEENIDEDILSMNEESGSDVNGGFMSGLNSVDFKSELLNEMDGDE